jgi:hypothetical protein
MKRIPAILPLLTAIPAAAQGSDSKGFRIDGADRVPCRTEDRLAPPAEGIMAGRFGFQEADALSDGWPAQAQPNRPVGASACPVTPDAALVTDAVFTGGLPVPSESVPDHGLGQPRPTKAGQVRQVASIADHRSDRPRTTRPMPRATAMPVLDVTSVAR